METQIVRCKCGRPAKRHVRSQITYSSKDGRSLGSMNTTRECCHSSWCLVKVLFSIFWEQFFVERSRVKRYGLEDDATIMKEVVPYDPNPY